MAGLDEGTRNRVHFLSPDEFFAFAETLEVEATSGEETVRGYKVKVHYKAVADQEKNARKQAISQVVLGALRRLKGGKNP